MTNALSELLYMHAVCIYVYLYMLYFYDYFKIFGSVKCENKLQLRLLASVRHKLL